MDDFVPYRRVAGAQVYQHLGTGMLYAYGGPGRAHWLPLGMPDDLEGRRLNDMVEVIERLEAWQVKGWRLADPDVAGIVPDE